jgi:hypothetical protein
MAQPIYLDPELQGIERERKLAQALQQRGMQTPQGQMVSGRFVAPSFTQYLANAFDTYSGGQRMEEAEKKSQAYANALRNQSMQDLQAYGQAVSGRPEQTVYGAGMEGPTMDVTPAVAPDYNKGLGILMGSKSPQSQALAQALLADQAKTLVLPEGATAIRGSLGGVGGQTIEGAPKEPTEYKEYVKASDPRNPNSFKGSFFEYQQALKKAGASTQTMNTGKDFSGQVGDIGKESKVTAMGAVQTADAANRIIQAVDSNKLFTGVGANQRLTAAQLADGLGLGGKDTTQKINNSRQAMQGLAQLTLQGRKQMRGEGAITQSESELAERAMSGEINFTAGEIRQLAEAAKRSAKFQYDMHQNIINTMRADPSTRGLIPYFDVPADTSIFNPRAVGSQSQTRSEADAIIGGGKR